MRSWLSEAEINKSLGLLSEILLESPPCCQAQLLGDELVHLLKTSFYSFFAGLVNLAVFIRLPSGSCHRPPLQHPVLTASVSTLFLF